MNSAHISAIIENLAKKHDINYTSKNPYYTSLTDDAIKLGEIYRDLKILLGQLQEIEDRHNLDLKTTEALETAIKEINEADHTIIKITKELLKDKENDD